MIGALRLPTPKRLLGGAFLNLRTNVVPATLLPKKVLVILLLYRCYDSYCTMTMITMMMMMMMMMRRRRMRRMRMKTVMVMMMRMKIRMKMMTAILMTIVNN